MSYRVIADESNGVQMTTADYDMPGDERGIWLVVNDDGELVDKCGDESDGGDYWTNRDEAQVIADALNEMAAVQCDAIA